MVKPALAATTAQPQVEQKQSTISSYIQVRFGIECVVVFVIVITIFIKAPCPMRLMQQLVNLLHEFLHCEIR